MKVLSCDTTRPGESKMITAHPAGTFLTPGLVSNYWDISRRISVGLSRFIFVPEHRKNVPGMLIAPCNPESVLEDGEKGLLKSIPVPL